MNRHQLRSIIDSNDAMKSTPAKIYETVMFVAIIMGILPLTFREPHVVFVYMEAVACAVFIFDYLAKWVTADCRVGAHGGWRSFALYPFGMWAILDLLTILPGLNLLGRAFVSLRVVRMLKIFRIFRMFKYSKQINLLMTVLQKESKVLCSVLVLALLYIFTTALIMFNSEDSFVNFFDSLYWAPTALTTVGYGDICPKTDIGRLISMLSSLFGVAVIALPSGIITAGYMSEVKRGKPDNQDSKM